MEENKNNLKSTLAIQELFNSENIINEIGKRLKKKYLKDEEIYKLMKTFGKLSSNDIEKPLFSDREFVRRVKEILL